MASQTAPGDANTPAPSSAKQPDSPAEPFPSLEGSAPSPASPARRSTHNSETNRDRGESSTSTLAGRFRSASKKFEESNPPAGFMLATAQIGSSIPSLTDIRRGSYGSEGWSAEGQYIEKERRASLVRRGSSQTSEDFARRRSSAGGSSPTTGKPGGELRHESLQETVDEHMPLGATTSGVGSSAAARGDIAMSTIKSNEPGNGQGDKRTSNDTSITPTNSAAAAKTDAKYRTTPFENGYQFPPKRKWTASTVIFLKAFWKFFITPIGFLVVIYGLNVVAWGGMLFLLLCNASPAMCKPTCNDINSPRRIWIEIDSQILNALFCVTGFGTIPWRFRDLYYLLQFRIKKNQMGLRRLAGINRGWFRLPGSQNLPQEFGPTEAQGDLASANIDQNILAFPLAKTPDAPLTGVRAPPTAMWKLDFVVWTMVWNTFLQAVLSGFMWGLNRYKRPSWSTGLFVALACIVAACGGIMSFIEGKKVKGIEGVPLSDDDKAILERDRELGITHYNNINDEGPKEENGKEKTGLFRRHGKKTEAEEVKVEEAAIAEGSEQIVR